MKVLDEVGPLRVPLIAGALLTCLPVPALWAKAPGSSLLRGLFDLTALTPGTSNAEWFFRTLLTFSVAYLALAVALAAVHQSAAIIHDFVPQRLARPDDAARRSWSGVPRGIRLLLLAVPALLAIAASLFASLDGKDPPCLAVGVAAGIALVVVILVLWLAVRIGTSCPIEDLAPVRALVRALEPRFEARFARAGYGGAHDASAVDEALGRHVRAAVLLVLGVLILLGVGVWAYLPSLHGMRVPALCSLYLLLMVLTWALSGATFFFDYYRVPILTLIALPVLLVGGSSYVYDVRPDAVATVLSPATIVQQRLGPTEPQDQRIVVVAAAGGGIQAAAWTARVLDGLAEAAASRVPDERRAFLQRIAMLSGVSGGSVGIAPFLLTMLPPVDGAASASSPSAAIAFDAASASSLDPVVATWVTIDLLPFRIGLDRGAALQNAWHASWAGDDLPAPPSLASLARAAAQGTMPGLMFNATSMTSGERVILGTTVPTAPLATAHSVFQAAVIATRDGTRTPEYRANNVVPDLDLATAIRMSATFPLVSPAALCDGCTPKDARQYLVDGGYVDNTGVQSAGEWVQELLASKGMERLKVSIVQIVPFSESETCAPASQQSAFDWLSPSQVAVPLSTLFNVRGPGQARGALNRLVQLQSSYPERVCVHSFVFAKCADRYEFPPPLSWHLTVGQREIVRDAWGEDETAAAAQLIDDVLNDRPC